MRLFLASAFAALCSCAAPTLDAEARYVQFRPSGDLQLSSGAANSGNSIDDLGLDESEATVAAVVDLKFGMPHLSISSQSSNWEGEGILASEISFEGVTLGVDTPVSSELDLALHSALLTWDFIPGSTELGIGFGVAGIELSGAFEGVVPAMGVQRVEFDESVPVPMLAVRAGVDLGILELAGTLSGLSAKVEDDEATIFDLDVSGRVHLLGMKQRGGAYITLGWRQLEVDVEVESEGDRIDAELGFAGPYAGLRLSF